MDSAVYVIDGANFSTLEGFFEEVRCILVPALEWSIRTLDGFDDILWGGFGTPDDSFTLVWQNAALSKERLGYQETVRQLEERVANCHPSNQADFRAKLELAKQHRGPTVFDWLITIIEEHDHIILRLD